MSAKKTASKRRSFVKNDNKCHECGQSFAHSASLLRHKMRFHIEAYLCKLCDTVIPNGDKRDTLRDHLIVAHGKQGYFKCGCCTWAFENKSDLYTHQQNMSVANICGPAKPMAVLCTAEGIQLGGPAKKDESSVNIEELKPVKTEEEQKEEKPAIDYDFDENEPDTESDLDRYINEYSDDEDDVSEVEKEITKRRRLLEFDEDEDDDDDDSDNRSQSPPWLSAEAVNAFNKAIQASSNQAIAQTRRTWKANSGSPTSDSALGSEGTSSTKSVEPPPLPLPVLEETKPQITAKPAQVAKAVEHKMPTPQPDKEKEKEQQEEKEVDTEDEGEEDNKVEVSEELTTNIMTLISKTMGLEDAQSSPVANDNELACRDCGGIFSNRACLYRHYSRVHVLKYSCQKCQQDIEAGGNEKMRQHMLQEHRIAPTFLCKCCGHVFDCKKLMKQHSDATVKTVDGTIAIAVKKDNPNNGQKVAMDLLTAGLNKLLPDVIKTFKQLQTPTVKTPKPQRKSLPSSIKLDFEQNTVTRTFETPTGAKSPEVEVIYSERLMGPLKRPDLKGEFVCSDCKKVFCHSASLLRHRGQFHGCNFKCELCQQFVNGTREEIRDHMQNLHDQPTTLLCHCCNHVFDNKNDIQLHNDTIGLEPSKRRGERVATNIECSDQAGPTKKSQKAPEQQPTAVSMVKVPEVTEEKRKPRKSVRLIDKPAFNENTLQEIMQPIYASNNKTTPKSSSSRRKSKGKRSVGADENVAENLLTGLNIMNVFGNLDFADCAKSGENCQEGEDEEHEQRKRKKIDDISSVLLAKKMRVST